jgi:hypothetical protein
MNARSRSLGKAIFTSGFVAGTVNIGAACMIYKANALIILQAIAGGLRGKSSFDQGLWAATRPAAAVDHVHGDRCLLCAGQRANRAP